MDKSKMKDILEWVYCIIIAVVLALIIRYYVGTPTIVKQPSMTPTLKQDERLILNRIYRTTKKTPQRGDIITFEAPESDTYNHNNNSVIAKYNDRDKNLFSKFIYYVLELNKKSYIKRVVALPGEHIKIENGKVFINDKQLEEPYLQEAVVTDSEGGAYTDLIVPEGTVFVMGDNRQNSSDSRRLGCIPFNKIESKVLIRFWPINRWGKVD
ncbi:MAG: signal peptidase I [Clostridia bacterium]|nr:signal peptidase I [Clostridia bacterium]